jgi:hypothetical protein
VHTTVELSFLFVVHTDFPQSAAAWSTTMSHSVISPLTAVVSTVFDAVGVVRSVVTICLPANACPTKYNTVVTFLPSAWSVTHVLTLSTVSQDVCG